MAETSIWTDQSGEEIEGQMFTFRDKGDRQVTLIPEGTALIRKIYRDNWARCRKKPIRVMYVSRNYRYERPQLGRYREFTQFGIEILGPDNYEEESKALLRTCLASLELDYQFDDQVTRGLSYYSRDGFEARCENLGAQKQIAGGGSYQDGCGWAIGVDRAVIAKMNMIKNMA